MCVRKGIFTFYRNIFGGASHTELLRFMKDARKEFVNFNKFNKCFKLNFNIDGVVKIECLYFLNLAKRIIKY